MQIIDKSVYTFSKNNPPFSRAVPGEVLLFKTMDCYSGQIKSEQQPVEDLDLNRANPAAGPVFIEGAEPGDVLVVDILDIQVDKFGLARATPSTGPLGDQSETRTRAIEVVDGVASFNDVKWLVKPMIGVIGTAPDGEDVACGFAGDHGGNMDSKLITKGVRLYFPVRVPGALLQMGDLHASMGDGEVCGTGIEVAGEVLVNTRLIKNFPLNWPVTETEGHWYVNTEDDFLEGALKKAASELRRLMEPVYGWDTTDCFIYLSINGDVGINQSALPAGHPNVTLRFGIPKIPGKGPLI
ncbi:acetamidase/formamidase family protein [Ruminococcaceae bacterium OttesenSCG-928-D13]|nr:acetamidase/formamidase family protein [Ruminococcaceae bacterium OttesenSCG-928-D13]